MKQHVGRDLAVDVVGDDVSHRDIVGEKVDAVGREDNDDAFYIVDLADILLKHKQWVSLLPRVEPFYAMKCNNDPAVLKLLTGLGIGFDCASKSEIQTMLNLGVPASKIVYANPCKQASHIRFAAQHNVALTTFDNEMELHKMKKLYPTAKLLLRIRTDDSKSLCQLGIKYGAPLKQCRHLLKVARDLGLNVVGVSFHVGSGCYDVSAFATAVLSARSVFDLAEQIGFKCHLLDIGGGFPGAPNAEITFEEVCSILRPMLDEHFPSSSGVRIIAEPGRYYSASSFTLAVNVYAKRAVLKSQLKETDENKLIEPANGEELGYMYYVNDGVYGSFNCLVFDHATVDPRVLEEKNSEMYSSSIWGPSCDSMDCITKSVMLPEVDVGEWLYFENMGAYTHSAASTFNGFKKPINYYVVTRHMWGLLKQVYPEFGVEKIHCHFPVDDYGYTAGTECMEAITTAT